MTKVFARFIPKDEANCHPEGWNGENEAFVIIYSHEEKSEKEISSIRISTKTH